MEIAFLILSVLSLLLLNDAPKSVHPLTLLLGVISGVLGLVGSLICLIIQ